MAKFIYVWIVFLLLIFSCEDSGTDPNLSKHASDTPLEISNIVNVIWHLEEFTINGRQQSTVHFAPFNLIIKDNSFTGFDGCNWYGGKYEINGHKITLYQIMSTQIACDLSVFPVCELRGTFALEITTSQLVLSASGKKLIFASKTTNDVKDSPLIGKIWQLTNSNAPEFPLLQSLAVLPRFEFNENRGVRIEWYCSSANIFGCNEQFGFYGLGDNHNIRFSIHGGSISRVVGLDDLEDQSFLRRIYQSTFYSLNTNTLRISDSKTGSFFEFTAQ